MQAYCMKYRTKREGKDARAITFINGRHATRVYVLIVGQKCSGSGGVKAIKASRPRQLNWLKCQLLSCTTGADDTLCGRLAGRRESFTMPEPFFSQKQAYTRLHLQDNRSRIKSNSDNL